LRCVELAWQFLALYGYRTRQSIRGPLEEWVTVMSTLFTACPPAAEWYMAKMIGDADELRKYLLTCPNAEVRKVFARILAACVSAIIRAHGQEAGATHMDALITIMLTWLKKVRVSLLSWKLLLPFPLRGAYLQIRALFIFIVCCCSSLMLRPLCGLLSIQECADLWKQIREYFDVFLEYAVIGSRQRAHLAQRGVVVAFVRFMCYDFQWTVYQNPDYR